MIFDVDFLNLELQAARTGLLPAALTDHPTFRALSFHESELDRPVLDEKLFRTHMAAAAYGVEPCWGLAPLFRQGDKIQRMIEALAEDPDAVTREITARMAPFTDALPAPDLRCVLYAGTHDGGFQIGYEHTVYLNVAAFTCREGLFQTLAHESYHARALPPEAEKRIRRLEEEDDYIGAVLYFTFEEGIADFIGNQGYASTPYSVIPLRPLEEGIYELYTLLQKCRSGEISPEDLYFRFRKTDCCYTAGFWIAKCIWDYYGKDGVDLWTRHCDHQEFYNTFRSTPWGADWPEL